METHRFNFVSNDNYKVDVQFYEGIPFIHVDVDKWSPSILKELYRVFNSLTESLKKLGCTEMRTITPNPKFVKLFGGETINKSDNSEVIKWDLIQSH